MAADTEGTAGEVPPAFASQRLLEAWRRYVPDAKAGEVDRLLPIVQRRGELVPALLAAYRAGLADGRARGSL